MVPIRKNLVAPERYSLKCPYPMKPTRIVVHNTGNDAPAKNEVSYMVRNDSEVGFHAAVDDVEVVQGIPFDRNAWACGDGNGKGNREGIHIEICYSKSGGARFIQAEKNAAEYIASLLREYGWGMDRVTKHQDYNGKYCPHRTLHMGWERFLKMVENYLKEDDDMTADEVRKIIAEELAKKEQAQTAMPVSAWAKAAWEEAVAAGELDGTQPRAPLTREQYAVIRAKQKRDAAE